MKDADAACGEMGFSILEALVSLVLLSLILAAVPGALRLGQRALASSERFERSAIDGAEDAFVFRTLAQTLPLREARSDGLQAMVFKGDARGLLFVAPLTTPFRTSGIYRFTLTAIADASGTARVQLSWQPYQPGPMSVSTADARAVLGEGNAFRLRYWGKRDTRSAPGWSDDWSATELPEAVEITYAHPRRPTIVRRVDLKLGG